MLEVDGLTARYGPIVAVRDATLEVKQGEIVALLGANGAGKTTTLGAITGLVPSRTGTVTFEGRDISRARPEEIVRAGISLAPEGRRLFTRLTVAENLRLGAATQRKDRERTEETRARLTELFPILASRQGSSAGQLSGGEQQQVAIARALMARPKLLLLDEPTLGMAPILIRRLFALIARVRDEEGITILLVEQNVRQALEISDRAYVMRTGRVELQGPAAQLREATSLVEQSYLGLRRG